MNNSTTRLDWDTDVAKHYVRRQAWLPAAVTQAESSRISGREPKYLTFCAAQAIDVFMLLKEGVLTRDPESGVVLNTYFCEKRPAEFNHISQSVGAHEQGFLGDFAEMILFEDDEETRHRVYDDLSQRYSVPLAKKLSTKDRHERFRATMPFDVMNLDICGSFFPPRGGVHSPMLRSIETLLDWQTASAEEDGSFGSFTLFLTAHIESERVNTEAMTQLIAMIERNQATYAGFAKELHDRFGTDAAGKIATTDFVGFYCVALPKVIVSAAFQRGWRAEPRFTGRYDRERRSSSGDQPTTYSMLTWVGRFDRYSPGQQPLGLTETPIHHDYADLIREIVNEPERVDSTSKEVSDEVESDLTSIVSFRDQYLSEVRANR